MDFNEFIYTIRYTLSSVFILSAFVLLDTTQKKRSLIKMAIAISLIYSLQIALVNLVDIETYKVLSGLITTALCFFAMLVVAKLEINKKIFFYFMLQLLNGPAYLCSNAMGYAFHAPNYMRVIVLIACYAILLFLLQFKIKEKILFVMDNIKTKWVNFCVLPIILNLLVMSSNLYFKEHYDKMFVPLCILSIAFTVSYYLYLQIIYSQIKELKDYEKKKRDFTAQSLLVKELEKEMNSYDIYIEKVRQYRHDLRHHNNIIAKYVKQKKYGDLEEYVSSLNDSITSSEIKQYSNNKVVNAILSIYEEKAQNINLEFIIDVSQNNDNVIDSMDIGIVISNLLENAFDEVLKINDEKKFVSIELEETHNHFKMTVKNFLQSVVEFEDELPISYKRGGGIGSKSIANIIKKYNGMINYVQADNNFAVNIYILK